MIYGKIVQKQIKTFLATSQLVGGVIRVVIVKEPHGPQFFFCTNLDASVDGIIEAFADRASIEHDVKEIWSAGQQQVRVIWTNIAAFECPRKRVCVVPSDLPRDRRQYCS